MNKSQPFRLSRIFIALVATTGILVNPVFASESSQPASQYTKQQNQRYLTSLAFADRQDCDDAQRGFIHPCRHDRAQHAGQKTGKHHLARGRGAIHPVHDVGDQKGDRIGEGTIGQ